MKLDNRPGTPPEKPDDGRDAHSGTAVTINKGDNSLDLVTNLPETDNISNTENPITVDKNEFEDEDLGIYEDTDDGDDLTDTELELEKLRLEKRILEENERREKEKAKAIETESKDVSEDKSETIQPESVPLPAKEDEKDIGVKERTIPKAELKVESRLNVKTWSSPAQDTGQHRNGVRQKPRAKTTNMALELAESRPHGEADESDKFERESIKSMRTVSSRASRKHHHHHHQQQQQQQQQQPSSRTVQHFVLRNASRLALESREAMFRRAMSLLSARCTSVGHELSADRLPFGYQVPKYFYVTQEKPVPMKPLKAWRGYNGNIYFEPIRINPVHDAETDGRAKTSIPRHANPLPMTAVPKSRSHIDKENRPMVESRSDSRQTNKSSQGSLLMSTRQMAILDKQAVLSRFNESLHEDLTWLEGQENTGSLAVRPKTFPERNKKDHDRDLQYNKERIRKGSVAHKLYVEKKSKQKPKLSVSGGKFIPPTSMSPLLRTQTQYSLSSHRLTTNSPDPYHLNDSKLPPLDQIRATIKHMDNKSETSYPGGKVYNRSVTLTDEMKPFVKYSPDVVAKHSQQANVC